MWRAAFMPVNDRMVGSSTRLVNTMAATPIPAAKPRSRITSISITNSVIKPKASVISAVTPTM